MVSIGSGKQGFASMDEAQRKLIASMGGKTAHAKGTAHQWTKETARLAGRKGGLRSAQTKRERKLAAAVVPQAASV